MAIIEIIAPQQSWPAEFKAIANKLSKLLGHKALRIDHIGSTAVPLLPAKDVIDIQITVADLTDDSVKTLLSEAGFDDRQVNNRDNLTGYDEHSPELDKLFFSQQPNSRRCHIHVRELGRINQRYALVFRDFLRADATTRIAYGQLKQELAARFSDDANAYYAIKDPYMDTVYRAACLWAEQAGWHGE